MSESTPSSDKNLVSIGEAAEILGVSIDTVRRWEKKGKLSAQRSEGGHRLFDTQELVALKSNKSLSVSEVAALLGVSASKLRSMDRDGLISPIRGANGEREYTPELVEEARKLLSEPRRSVVSVGTPAVEDTDSSSETVRMPVAQSEEFVNGSIEEQATASSKVPSEQHYTEETEHVQLPSGRLPALMTTAALLVFMVLSGAAVGLYGSLQSGNGGGVRGLLGFGSDSKAPVPSFAIQSEGSSRVLALTSEDVDRFFEVNVPSFFNDSLTVGETTVTGPLVLQDNVTGENVNIDIGEGTITASNVVYSLQGRSGDLRLIPGDGVSISGLTISAPGGPAFSSVTAGSGTASADDAGGTLAISTDGTITVTADDATDTLTFAVSETAYTAGDDLVLTGTTFSVDPDITKVQTITFDGTGKISGLDDIDDTTESTLEGKLDLGGDLDGTIKSANIKDGKILEQHLSADNSATDEHCLTSEGDGFEWQACGATLSGFTLSGDSGTDQTVSDGDTLTVTGGDGVTTAASATDTITIDVDILASADGAGGTSSNAGLELSGGSTGELALLQGCSDNQILKWDETSSIWECAADSAGAGSYTWTLSDGSTTQTVDDTETVTFVDGTSIDAVVSATNNVTIDVIDDSIDGTELADAITLDASTLVFDDGTNTLATLTDAGTTGNLDVTGALTLGTALAVAEGGTGATSLTDGGVLLGSGTGAVTAMGVLADGTIIIGDGTTDPTTLAAFTASTGTLRHESGGLEADVSAYTGLLAVSGGATSEVDAKSELEAQIADVSDFAEADGDVFTGVHDFGGATSIELVNSATPTVDANGEIAFDNTVTDFTTGVLRVYGSDEEQGVVTLPIADFTSPSDNTVVTYNATDDEFELSTVSGAGGMSSFTIADDDTDTYTIDDSNTLRFTSASGVIATNLLNGDDADENLDLDVADDSLDFTEISDTPSLDAATTLTLGANNFDINLDSTGEFAIQDGGSDVFHVADDTGVITISDDLDFSGSGAENVSVTSSSTTADVLTVTGSVAATNDGVDGLVVAHTLTDSTTSAGARVTVTNADNATAADTFYGVYVEVDDNSTLADDTAYGIYVNNPDQGAGTDADLTLDAFLYLNTAEDTAGVVMADGIILSSAGSVITDAIDVSDSDITNALNIGANVITGTTGTIDFTNFDVSSVGGITAEEATATHIFGSAASLEIPNSATPTVDANGEIAFDNTVTDFTTGVLRVYGSDEEQGVVTLPIADFTSPTDGHVIKYNATDDEFELAAASGGFSSWTIGDDDTDTYSIVDGNTLRFTSASGVIATNLLNGDDADENLDLDVADDSLDFTEISDTPSLDAATTLTLGANNFDINLDSTGEFAIQDGGSDVFHVADDTGVITISDDLDFSGSGAENVSVTSSSTTADVLTVTGSVAATNDGVDGLVVAHTLTDSTTSAGARVTVTNADNATAADTFYGVYVEVDDNSTLADDTAYGIYVNNPDQGAGTDADLTLDAFLYLNTAEDTAGVVMADGIILSSAGSVITDAIDVSDSDITNALNIGANVITGTTGTIDFTNFDVSSVGGITAEEATATHIFGSAASLEIPNSATPTVDANGEIAFDNTVTDFTTGVLRVYGSDEEQGVVTLPIADFTSPTDGHVIKYNATDDEFELAAASGGFSSWTIGDDDTDTYSIVDGNTLRFTSASGVIATNLLNGDDADENLDLDVADDSLDFTEISDTLSVDAATSITLGANNLTFTNDSTGEFRFTGLSGGAGSALCIDGSSNLVTCSTGSSSATLQSAYDSGNSITTTDANDIDFVLDDTTTDSNFDIDIATDSTSTVTISRAAGAGTSNPSQLLKLEDLDSDLTIAAGLLVEAAGTLTDAIDVSDAQITNALNIGANVITGTTGTIDFTNFDVSSVGGITAEEATATHIFGSAASLEIPNSATPTVDANGEIAFDNTVTDFTTGVLRVYGSDEEQGVVTLPIADFTSPTDGHVIKYNATDDEFELAAASGGFSSWTIGDDDTDTYSIVDGNTLRFTSASGVIATNLLNGDDADENLDLDVADDSLDFTEISDTPSLDAATTLTLGANNFDINLDSTGEFAIQDGGSDVFHVADDTGVITISDDLDFSGSGAENVSVTSSSTTADVLTVTGSVAATNDGVDGLVVAHTLTDSTTSAGARVTVTNADNATAADTFYGVYVEVDDNSTLADDTAYGIYVNNPDQGAGTDADLTLDAFLYLNTAEDTAGVVMADGIILSSAGSVITDAIDVSDSDITNALNIGANVITGTTGTIDFTNFDVSSVGGITAEEATATHIFGSAASLEIPNSATPTVDANGEIAFDNTVTDFTTGVLRVYGSDEEQGVVTLPIADFTSPSDNTVVTYNATDDEFELSTVSGAGGMSSFTIADDDTDTYTIDDSNTLRFTSASGVIATNLLNGDDADENLDLDVADDSLDFTEISDTPSLDAATTLTLGANNFDINLDSTGEFAIQDGGSDVFHVADDTGVITISDDLDFSGSGAENVSVTSSSTTADVLTVTGSVAATNDGVDGLVVAHTLTDSTTSAGARVTVTNADNATAADTFYGVYVEVDDNSTLADDTAYGIYVNNPDQGAGTDADLTLDAFLYLNTAEDTAGVVMADGIILSSAGSVITDAIDVSDSDITNALNIGANVITGTTGTIDFTNFDVSSVGGITAEEATATHIFGSAASLEIPNSATPTVDANGEIAFDNTVTDFTTGVLRVYGSDEEQGVVTLPIADFTSPTDGHVIKYNATDDEFELAAASGGASDLQGAYDGGNTIEILPATGPTIITETTATASQTTDLLQLTINPATGGDTSGDALQITLDAVDANSSTGHALHVIIDQDRSTGNAILVEDDGGTDYFIVDELGAVTAEGALNVGGITGVAYNAISDSGTATTALTDDDLFVEDILEVDGTLDIDGAATLAGATTGGASATLDFASATSVSIPVDGTIDANGEIGVDATDNQFKYQVGGTAYALTGLKKFSITLESPADADNFNLMKAPYALTITEVNCIIDPADSGETLDIDIQENDGNGDAGGGDITTSAISCGNTNTQTTSFSNATIDKDDWIALDIGSAGGDTVSEITVTVEYTIDPT